MAGKEDETFEVKEAAEGGSLTNQYPHRYNSPDSYFLNETYCLCMVGLPATGKTFVAQRLARWLSFFHDVNVRVFNLGNQRRKMVGAKVSHDFFNLANAQNREMYLNIRTETLKEIKTYLSAADKSRPRIAIYDACSHTKETRKWILDTLDSGPRVIFIECIVNDKTVLKGHLGEVHSKMPDYKGVDSKQLEQDYKKRIAHFRKRYEPMDNPNLSWIKLVDNAEQLCLNRIRGFFPGQIFNFLVNLHTIPRPIYLSRHGQSEYNSLGKIGGDSGLTHEGVCYARKLAEFMKTNVLVQNKTNTDVEEEGGSGMQNAMRARLYTSTLQRTRQTVQFIDHRVQSDGWVTLRHRQWRALDEIFAGVFDGMTYEEIKNKAPEAAASRKKNKLTYRYPRGESYLDLIKRVEQVMLHMQRHKDPVVIVAHQAVLRVVYTYFMGLDREKATNVPIPLNTVIKLTPYAYHTKEV